MKKKIMVAMFVGVVIGVCVVFPGIFAWTHNMNYLEVLHNMIVPIH